MQLKIDHVTIGASRLQTLQDAFAEVGLDTEYGGTHSNGITHMSLLGFDDGSYIELISTVEPGAQSPWWHEHIVGDGGPCAWAVEVGDVAAEAERVRSLGISVHGPTYYTRERPDGTRIEWDLAILGDEGMGALLPFIIKDRTPRDRRVLPSTSVAGTELVGVAVCVLGVESTESESRHFQRLYNLPAPQCSGNAVFGARLARFAGQGFALAAPLDPGDWLGRRLARFGVSPCALLIGTRDLRASMRRFRLSDSAQWFDRELAWFNSRRLRDYKIGLISL
jgi:hypothetical protein